MSYKPPYVITPIIVSLVAKISEKLGQLSVLKTQENNLYLRRINRIRTIQGSLAIEGNTLTEMQITAVLDGKAVIAPPREVQEVRNAIKAYEKLTKWRPTSQQDLLAAHQTLMQGLIDDVGQYRNTGVGVMKGKKVIHMAPSAECVNGLMFDLFDWLACSDEHPLILSSIFHYEFAFIHPFADGNGRMGRLWQTLILSQWQDIFSYLPVESLIYAHQDDYYLALQQSTKQANSVPFIEFILQMILDSCNEDTPQVTPQVKQLISIVNGEMSKEELMFALSLKDARNFRQRYLLPAISNNLIEMKQADKPTARHKNIDWFNYERPLHKYE
ncbi:Fic domain protein, KPN_03553 type [uncultured Gammaproteobacteria bacterium]|nr:Fic domain protein, KPN_03553 type [uncultured Gammaproteobacteria bacterium]